MAKAEHHPWEYVPWDTSVLPTGQKFEQLIANVDWDALLRSLLKQDLIVVCLAIFTRMLATVLSAV